MLASRENIPVQMEIISDGIQFGRPLFHHHHGSCPPVHYIITIIFIIIDESQSSRVRARFSNDHRGYTCVIFRYVFIYQNESRVIGSRSSESYAPGMYVLYICIMYVCMCVRACARACVCACVNGWMGGRLGGWVGALVDG